MRRLAIACAGLLAAALASISVAAAPPSPDAASRIPDMFDPDHHVLAPPDLSAVKSIRFLTTDDFPPFHFALDNGSLTGFDIDLARALCRDMKIACTIQARPFDSLTGEIKAGRDDALIAAVANTPAARADLTFTAPYYTTPARFAVKVASPLEAKGLIEAITPEALAGHTIGVEAGTAHEAYLKTFFPGANLKAYRSQADLRAALQMDEVNAIFADGIGLAQWLNGNDGQACCAFRGGAFTESRFFGNGVSIAVAKDNVALRQALDYELAKLTQNGTYTDIYLKYFSIGFY